MTQRILRTTTLAFAAAGWAAAASAGITDIAGLQGVRVWETTYTTSTADFAAADPRLSAVLAGASLSGSSRDFGFFPGDENYDIYYSDAAGTLDAHGSYLTIDGNCFVPYNCFNINEVQLKINGVYQGAGSVVRAVYGRSGSFSPGSHVFAADGQLSSLTAMGDTIGMGVDARMSITLAFDGVPQVPEPQTYALMAAGLMGVGFLARRRRSVI